MPTLYAQHEREDPLKKFIKEKIKKAYHISLTHKDEVYIEVYFEHIANEIMEQIDLYHPY